jgi:hypothetical protein
MANAPLTTAARLSFIQADAEHWVDGEFPIDEIHFKRNLTDWKGCRS